MPEKSAMPDIPPTMRALVAPRQGPPSNFEIQDMPTPEITVPDHVLVRVHATGMSTGLLHLAGGRMNLVVKPEYVLHTLSLYVPDLLKG